MATKRPAKKKAAAKSKTKPVLPVATTLESHLDSIRSLAAAADPGETGACLISDPQSGQSRCILTDRNTCKALHGVFLGGPCGG